jgi:hypothetical protein
VAGVRSQNTGNEERGWGKTVELGPVAAEVKVQELGGGRSVNVLHRHEVVCHADV